MMHGRNIAHGDRARVRHVLNHKWNPIGVFERLKVAYEYDRDIATIYLMLFDERTNRQRLANQLRELATTSMVPSDRRDLRERCDLTATALMPLRSESTTH